MPKFRITYHLVGRTDIEAKNLAEAQEKADERLFDMEPSHEEIQDAEVVELGA